MGSAIPNNREEPSVKRKLYSNPSMDSSSSSSSSFALRANLYAQEMNNSAASCIEIGHYGRAVTSLTRALELYKRQQGSNDVKPCNSYKCTLDGSIVQAGNPHQPSRKANPVPSKGDHNTNPSGDYVCRRPIKVIAQGHTMGPALYVIIMYNIGLANHLYAISSSVKSEQQRAKVLHVAITSYNIAIEMQASILQGEKLRDSQLVEQASSLWSIRFKMMVTNNMSQCYKLKRVKTKHEHCLRRLLSFVMLVLDQNVLASSTPGRIAPIWRIETDGFLKNTESLILHPEYTADSA